MRVSALHPERARTLYNCGITSVAELLEQPVEDIVQIFVEEEGFLSRKKGFHKENERRCKFYHDLVRKILKEARLVQCEVTAKGGVLNLELDEENMGNTQDTTTI